MQFISRIKNQAQALNDVGEVIWDLSVIAKITYGLPSKYGAFVSAWSLIDVKSQKLDLLQERLLKEEKRICEKDPEIIAVAVTGDGQKRNGLDPEKCEQGAQGGQ